MLFNNKGYSVSEEEVSQETSAYIMEAALMDLSDEDISMFLENQSEVDAAMSEGVLLEKSIVRLDKHAKLSKAHKMAIFKLAKEKNDPKYKQLVTVWKMERYLEAWLTKKYGNKALRMARQSVSKNQNSSSKIIKKAANKQKKMLNGPIKLGPKPTETLKIR